MKKPTKITCFLKNDHHKIIVFYIDDNNYNGVLKQTNNYIFTLDCTEIFDITIYIPNSWLRDKPLYFSNSLLRYKDFKKMYKETSVDVGLLLDLYNNKFFNLIYIKHAFEEAINNHLFNIE